MPAPRPIVSATVDGCSVRFPLLLRSAPSSIRSDVSVISPLVDETFAEVMISFVVTFSITSPVPSAATSCSTVRFPPARTEMLPLLAVLTPSRPLTFPRASAFDSLR